jgi:hypothetical protein
MKCAFGVNRTATNGAPEAREVIDAKPERVRQPRRVPTVKPTRTEGASCGGQPELSGGAAATRKRPEDEEAKSNPHSLVHHRPAKPQPKTKLAVTSYGEPIASSKALRCAGVSDPRRPRLHRCQVQDRGPHAASPNSSVEARPNGKAPGRRGALVYHAPHRPGTSPSVPPHLER